MKQKPALLISLFLTVFTLVMLSSVVAKAFSGANTDPAPVTVQEQAPQTVNSAELEKAYQDVIDQANQQILSLQGQIQAMSEENAAQDTTGQGNFIDPQEAVVAAMEVAITGSDLVGDPELVD